MYKFRIFFNEKGMKHYKVSQKEISGYNPTDALRREKIQEIHIESIYQISPYEKYYAEKEKPGTC